MKVCDVTEFYGEASGGVRTYLSAKRRHLTARRGWSHVLIAPGERDERVHSGGAVTYRIAGPRVPFSGAYRLLGSASKVRAALAAERPDLIEVGSPFLAPWLVTRALGAFRPPVVGFFHSDFPGIYSRLLGRALGPALAPWMERLAWTYARRVHSGFALTLAASPSVARKLARHGIPRVRQVSLGVDSRLFDPRRREPRIRERLGLGDRTLLLYVGRLAPDKGIRTLLSAFDRLPHERYRLLVVGDGPLGPSVAAWAQDRPAVVLHGHEPDRGRLAALYASADLLIAPSPFETFGLAALEAQASGLPVIAARAGALPERIGPACGLLVEPDDPAALASLVQSLSIAKRREMGLAARAHAETHYSWDRVLRDLAEVYEEVTGTGAARQ